MIYAKAFTNILFWPWSTPSVVNWRNVNFFSTNFNGKWLKTLSRSKMVNLYGWVTNPTLRGDKKEFLRMTSVGKGISSNYNELLIYFLFCAFRRRVLPKSQLSLTRSAGIKWHRGKKRGHKLKSIAWAFIILVG